MRLRPVACMAISTASAAALPPSYRLALRDVHAGQLRDERLVFEERLEAALAGLGLVRRIGGVELAAGGHHVDHGGDEMVVAAAAEEAGRLAGGRVRGGQLGQMGRQVQLAQARRHAQLALHPQFGRNHGEQVVDRRGADGIEHRPAVGVGVREIGHEAEDRGSGDRGLID